VLDANFQQPDIGRMIGEEPPHSVLELMARAKDLDRHLLDACMQPVSGTDLNLTLLSPPLEGQSAVTASLSELAECLKEIRSFRKFWIVDMPRHLDKHFVTLVDQCDRILLVMEATVIGVAAAQRWLAILDDLGYERDRVACVLNRAGSKFSGVEQQLGKCFPNREIIRLPNASNLLWECSMHGKIPALSEPNHPYCKSIFKLAEQVRQSISVR
jgi:Flp pilus assembly CpaE family ATPase